MRSDMMKLVIFELGGDLFAADVLAVDRVLRYAAPSGVPDVPSWVEGVIEHRGGVIPVIDLRRRVGAPETAIGTGTRTIVLNTSAGYVAGIVDAVREVAVVPTGAVTAPPPLFRGMSNEAIRGIAKVGDRLVVVLDVERVLASADRVLAERAATAAGADD
ncbi:MAG TPA: chemotaxis protein CheW [Gemmatimonadaceae bacterium]